MSVYLFWIHKSQWRIKREGKIGKRKTWWFWSCTWWCVEKGGRGREGREKKEGREWGGRGSNLPSAWLLGRRERVEANISLRLSKPDTRPPRPHAYTAPRLHAPKDGKIVNRTTWRNHRRQADTCWVFFRACPGERPADVCRLRWTQVNQGEPRWTKVNWNHCKTNKDLKRKIWGVYTEGNTCTNLVKCA